MIINATTFWTTLAIVIGALIFIASSAISEYRAKTNDEDFLIISAFVSMLLLIAAVWLVVAQFG